MLFLRYNQSWRRRMRTVDCNTWADAKKAIEDIRRQNQYTCASSGPWLTQGRNDLLFRGHADAAWELKTTLDRHSEVEWHLWGYLDLAADCLPKVQSVYPGNWVAVDHACTEKFCRRKQLGALPLPMLPFLIYLRHHGFPSLFLDWSISPWIAAHFAVSDSVGSSRVAIFVYCILHKACEVVGKPTIHAVRSNVTTHARHFLQQARYTYCTRYDAEDGCHVICSHKDATPSNRAKNAVLYKITFPAEERLRVLRELHENNINDFSLFQNEEGLMKSLAAQEIDLALDYPPTTPPTVQ